MRAVAAKAGVSLATVSRVISGSNSVRPATAAKVQRVIDELNFIPNASATTLKYGRSNTYGIVISNITNPFFMEFLRDFEALLTTKQQGIMVANAEFPERLQSSIRRMLTSQVDGVVVIPAEEEFEPYVRFALKGVPLVTFDRRAVYPLVSDISYNFDKGMLQAVGYLYGLGHRHIGLISGTRFITTSKLRMGAFIAAMKKYGLSIRPEWLVEGNYTVDSGDQQMRKLMKLSKKPTAVIAVNDLSALGAIRGAHSLTLSVPRDVSIIGIDDTMLANVTIPSLTTIRLPKDQAAKACINSFAYMKENSNRDGMQSLIDTWLVVRESTAPPRSKLIL